MERLEHHLPHAIYAIYRHQADPAQPYTLFLHGGPGLHNVAERTLLGPTLHGRMNVLWFDLLGCGENRPINSELLTYDRMIDDVQALVEKYVPGGLVHLVGHSAGARLGHALVGRIPDRIGRIVFIAPHEDRSEAFKRVLRRARKEKGLTLDAAEAREFSLLLDCPDEKFGAGELQSFLTFLFKTPDFFELYFHNPEAMVAYASILERFPLNPEVFVRLSADEFRMAPVDYGVYAGHPVLIIQGEKDQVTSYKENGEVLARRVPHAVVRFIPGAAHFPHLENPGVCLPAMMDFLYPP